MANDGSETSIIEQWLADTLAALTDSGSALPGNKVFKTADLWTGQVSAEKSGAEAFIRYAPFAFVSYIPSDAFREGGDDQRLALDFAVAIGVTSKYPGVARFGDTGFLGANKIEQLVIDAIDHQRPSSDSVKCDDLKFQGSILVIDRPKVRQVQLNFTADRTGTF